eukprot:CAMPEP_0176225946 /NCGR_PEP_ID=MMETSP0121_2-20121125/22014_1 /TAXON_ID=160619 /ORGANISM="Kryptoperidinium foliaceum, Strain CCMP 1326" /LENGTH=339 /DNA_ID=CAMNT_0017565211 /DNA_START=63 /DNA_END=1078 /DNA_ORIENTATION=-
MKLGCTRACVRDVRPGPTCDRGKRAVMDVFLEPAEVTTTETWKYVGDGNGGYAADEQPPQFQGREEKQLSSQVVAVHPAARRRGGDRLQWVRGAGGKSSQQRHGHGAILGRGAQRQWRRFFELRRIVGGVPHGASHGDDGGASPGAYRGGGATHSGAVYGSNHICRGVEAPHAKGAEGPSNAARDDVDVDVAAGGRVRLHASAPGGDSVAQVGLLQAAWAVCDTNLDGAISPGELKLCGEWKQLSLQAVELLSVARQVRKAKDIDRRMFEDVLDEGGGLVAGQTARSAVFELGAPRATEAQLVAGWPADRKAWCCARKRIACGSPAVKGNASAAAGAPA